MKGKFTHFFFGMLLLFILEPSFAMDQHKGVRLIGSLKQRPVPTTVPMRLPQSGIPSILNQTDKRKIAMKVGNGNTTLYGTVIYSASWTSGNHYGVYSFPASNGTSLTSVYEDNTMLKATGNALYHHGGAYSVLSAQTKDDYVTGVNYYELDAANDWEETNESELDANWYAYDMTYDPTTFTSYGAMANADGGQVLCKLDWYGLKQTKVGTLTQNMAAIAINGYGTLYGIGQNGKLYTISTEDASLTEIGSTGIAPAYMQSATFDFATNKLYWATTTTADEAGLYEVDVNTGAATLVSRFPNDEEVVGLYSLPVMRSALITTQ